MLFRGARNSRASLVRPPDSTRPAAGTAPGPRREQHPARGVNRARPAAGTRPPPHPGPAQVRDAVSTPVPEWCLMTDGNGEPSRRIRIRVTGDDAQNLAALHRWLSLEEWFARAE